MISERSHATPAPPRSDFRKAANAIVVVAISNCESEMESSSDSKLTAPCEMPTEEGNKATTTAAQEAAATRINDASSSAGADSCTSSTSAAAAAATSASSASACRLPASSSSRKRKKSPVRDLPTSSKYRSQECSATSASSGTNETPLTEEEEHRALVSAIFDVGMIESSPLHIQDHMTKRIKEEYSALNMEKIKSKLQKYRQSKDKNKEAFMQDYDASLADFLIASPIESTRRSTTPSPGDSTSDNAMSSNNHQGGASSLRHLGGTAPEDFSSGEVAAYLTHSVMSEGTQQQQERGHHNTMPTWPPSSSSSQQFRSSWQQLPPPPTPGGGGSILELPILSQDELNGALGQSFQNFIGLYHSLTAELYLNRARPTPGQFPSSLLRGVIPSSPPSPPAERASTKPEQGLEEDGTSSMLPPYVAENSFSHASKRYGVDATSASSMQFATGEQFSSLHQSFARSHPSAALLADMTNVGLSSPPVSTPMVRSTAGLVPTITSTSNASVNRPAIGLLARTFPTISTEQQVWLSQQAWSALNGVSGSGSTTTSDGLNNPNQTQQTQQQQQQSSRRQSPK